ncbi:sensor histidine kinase [Nitrospira sp. Nam74]
MAGEHDRPENVAERVRADERHRLSLYLHDHVAQVLTLAKLQVGRIQQALGEPLDPAKQARLQTIVDSLIPELDAAMRAVEEEMFLLNPTGLTEVGLTPVLEQECVTFSRRTGIPCTQRCEPLDVDAERGALVVLIVREALANIARHSRAANVEVTLQQSGEHGILSVRDDGIGIDSIRITAAESFGVRAMKERAGTLRGELTVTSRLNEGCHITLSFPLALHSGNTALPD